MRAVTGFHCIQADSLPTSIDEEPLKTYGEVPVLQKAGIFFDNVHYMCLIYIRSV